MAVSPADLDQYPPEGAGGEEADLHKHVPDDIFRLAQRPGPLRDALEARAAVSNFPVQTVFSRLLAHCFISFSRENVDLAAALLTLACLGEGKEVSWTHEPQLKALLGQHSIREASRYLPDGICAEKLAELERWRCDSRTAACACLLLLCATREALTDGAQAMALAKALTEVCSALGRHSAHDSMAWGCDLDPGNTISQLSNPPGGAPAAGEKPAALRAGAVDEPAGVADSMSALSLSGQDAMQTLNTLCKSAANGEALSTTGLGLAGQSGAAGTSSSSGAPGSQIGTVDTKASAAAGQPVDQDKVERLMQKLDEQLQLLRQATPLLRQRAQQLTDAQAAEVREQLALVLDQQTDQFEESMKALKDSLPKLQLPAGDLQLPGLEWPAHLPPTQMDHSLPPLPPVPGQSQLRLPLLEQGKGSAVPGLPGSKDMQSLPPKVAQILAESAGAVEAIETLTPATDELFAKEVADVLHSMKGIQSQDAAKTGTVGSQPEPSLDGVLRSQELPVGRAAAASGPSTDMNGAQAATADIFHAAIADGLQRELGSQGPAGQLAKLQGNPLPSRRAGPAARSHTRRSMRELGFGIVEEEGKVQATWAFVRAAVPLLKQVVGGRVELASQQVAPQLCCALARLCGQTSQGGRAFAAHIFKECAAHLAKLTKSDDTKLTAGPPLLLCQLLLSEQPAPSKARYPPIPPSSTLKISSVFVQLGVVDHLRQHLLEANDQLKSAQSGIRKAYFGSPDSEGIVPVTCEALAVFALNPVSHRSLKAAATFQSTLNLLSCFRSVEKSRFETFETFETKELTLELVRALAAHCPSVAESAALWGQSGLAVLSAYLKQGNETALREAAAAALDAILRLHKIQAVKEVLAKGMRIRGLLDKYDAVRGENLRFFPELRHRVAKMLRVLAYDSGGAALPELLRPGKDGCVPWLVNELGNLSTHWCTRAELAAVLGSLARIPALSAAMARSRRSVAGKDIMLDPRAGIRKAGAMPPLMALLKEVVENKTHALNNEIVVNALAGVVGVGITYIKDDEDIIPLLKVELLPQLLSMMDVKTMTGSEGQRKLTLGNATILAYCLRWAGFREEFVKRDGHIMATDLMLWCANNEPAAPAPGKDDFHMETVCTLVNIIGNAARSSVKALEYINKQGGLPVAARYLARAVALPPSNTSWYMGLSNGAAGLCDLQAVLVSNPEVAAAVAEICMVGLATTAQATKGPPKPDKARIDRLAYVVTSLSTLATYLKASAPKAIVSALEQGTFQALLDLKRTLHLSNATIGYLQAFVMSTRNPTKDAAAANANMCALLEEEAAEKERELREAAKRAKRKAKKARARLQRLEEEEAFVVSAASDANESHAEPVEVPAEAASAGDDNHDTDPTEHNSTASGGMHESEESADEPELLPDSWETMAEEAAGHESVQESADAFSVSSEMEVMLGGSPDSGSWTTVGIKKTPTSTPQGASAAPATIELPKPAASSPQAPRAASALPSVPAALQPRASLQALAAARSHTASMLKAQVGILEKPARGEAATAPGAEAEAGGTSSWSQVAAQGLPAKSPAATADGAGELPAHAAWAGSRGAPARPGHPGASRAGPPLHRQGSPQLSSSLFSEPQMQSSRGNAQGHSDSGHHSPVSSSRLSTAGAPESPMSAFEATASHLGRLSSAAEQAALASMVSPPPSQAQGMLGNLSPAVPSPGSLFLTSTGSMGAPSLWSPASLSLGLDAQRAGDWLSSAAALPAPAAAHSALWGSTPFVRPGTSLYTNGSTDFSSVVPAPESREEVPGTQRAAQPQAVAEAQRSSRSVGGDAEPNLAADPWAQDVGVPAGHNPWSAGLGGLQPQQEQHSSGTGTSLGLDPARGSRLAQVEGGIASHRVSQLNPAAGEYLGSGPVHQPQAVEQPGNRAPAACSNIWGAQGLFGLPAVSHAPQAPLWAASMGAEPPSVPNRPASEGTQWTALQQPLQAAPGPVDWGHGASPPFSDAPLFLSSMMQQILPEEDTVQGYSALSHNSSTRLPQSQSQAHNGSPALLSQSRSYSPASGQPSAQGALPGLLPMSMPMSSGQHAGQDWDAVGVSMEARSPGPSLQQHNGLHPEQPLPMPALEKRPSDLLHAFAQASQQARAQANNLQRYKPSGTPSTAIAQAGSQSQAARSPLQVQRREAFAASAMTPGRPSERLHALGRPSNGNVQ